MIELHNVDCMEYLATLEDNAFELAIVDPPYGIGADKPSKKPNRAKQKNGKVLNVKSVEYTHKKWDNQPADDEYFNELKRVSKNRIIWGVNYYSHNLIGGRIVWDKVNGNSDQFGCEIAYNSVNKRTDLIRFMWRGMFQGLNISTDILKANKQQGNKALNENRIHPTQKPVKLYEWLLMNYAKEGDRILDTHLGSGSIAIACHNLGFDLVGCELDTEYFNAAKKRLEQHQSQLRIPMQ